MLKLCEKEKLSHLTKKLFRCGNRDGNDLLFNRISSVYKPNILTQRILHLKE